MRGSELRRIAAEDLGDGRKAQRLDILPQQRARFRAIIDELDKRRATRERLETKRSGAGEQIEHACAGDRITVGVRKDVEQRLAQAIRGWANGLRLRRRKGTPAQSATDDSPLRGRRRCGRLRLGVSRSSKEGRAFSPRRGRTNLLAGRFSRLALPPTSDPSPP